VTSFAHLLLHPAARKPIIDRFGAAVLSRPAAVCLAALAAGIFAQGLGPPLPAVWLIVAAGLGSMAMWLRRSAARMVALGLATAFLGLAAAQAQYNRAVSDDILNDAGDLPKLAQLQVRLDEEPRFYPRNTKLPLDSTLVEQATAGVIAIRAGGQWRPASGLVSLFLDEPDPNLTPGRLYRVIGMLQHPGGADPDIAEHDRRHGIGAELAVNHAEGIEPVGDASMPWLPEARQWVRRLISEGFGSRLLEDSSHRGGLDRAILCQLILGDRDPLAKQARDDFAQSGTAWQLSISGLHIALVAGLAALAGRLLRWPPRSSLLAAAVAAITYAAIADSGQASWRATLCCVVASCGLLARRSVDATQVFCVCLLAMLLVSPMQAYDAATQIGVAAVVGLLMWSGPVWDVAQWIGRGDWDVALRAASMGRGRVDRRVALLAGLRAAARWGLGVLAASIVAFASTAPVIAYHFQEVSPWTPVASLLLLPFTVAAMFAGLAKGLLSLLWPGGAGAWAWLAAVPVDLLRHVVGWLAAWPGAAVKVGQVPVWTPIPCWAVLIGLRLLVWLVRPARATKAGPR
jgi:predicted membrane metal-binding protein